MPPTRSLIPTFDTTLLSARQTATGTEVSPEVVAALGSSVAVMGGKFMIPVSAEHRAGAVFRRATA